MSLSRAEISALVENSPSFQEKIINFLTGPYFDNQLFERSQVSSPYEIAKMVLAEPHSGDLGRIKRFREICSEGEYYYLFKEDEISFVGSVCNVNLSACKRYLGIK